MIGAIAGDIIGSPYEGSGPRPMTFELFGRGARFTDDTVCTLAVAQAVMDGSGDFDGHLRRYVRRHPRRGYGKMFRDWAFSEIGPYGSFGNGAAMRVAALPRLARSLDEALAQAAASAAVSHDHPSAIKGAEAVVFATWQALQGVEAAEIRAGVEARFGYNLAASHEALLRLPSPGVTTESSVPVAIASALIAFDYEDAVRTAVSLGGDTDTVASIAGGIAEARFGVPGEIAAAARGYLTDDLEAVLARFEAVVGRG